MAAPEVVTPVDDEQDDDRPEPKMFEFGGPDDFQLQQAINLLEGRPVSKSGPRTTAAKKQPASTAAAQGGKDAEAEKKTEQSAQPEQVERFRLTPDGLVPVNE